MRCLTCKYDLSHLAEQRCPECGRAFDPDDPQSFDAPHRSQSTEFPFGRVAIAKIGMAAGVCLIVLAIGTLVFADTPPAESTFYILAGIALVTVHALILKRLRT